MEQISTNIMHPLLDAADNENGAAAMEFSQKRTTRVRFYYRPASKNIRNGLITK